MGGEGGGEIGGRLVDGEQVYVDGLVILVRERGVAASRGDQGVSPRAVRGPQSAQVGGVGEVVEYDQPGVPLCRVSRIQPGEERARRLLGVAGVGAEYLGGGLRVAGDDRGPGAGADPHQQVQVPGRPQGAGAPGGELRLADSAHTGHHQARRRRSGRGERLRHLGDGGPVLEAVGWPGQDADLVRSAHRRSAVTASAHRAVGDLAAPGDVPDGQPAAPRVGPYLIGAYLFGLYLFGGSQGLWGGRRSAQP